MGLHVKQNPWIPTKRKHPIQAEHGTSPGPACVTLPTSIGTVISDSRQRRAPAYSFGARHLHLANAESGATGPGPAQYNTQGMLVKGKEDPHAATMTSRHPMGKQIITPSPCDYNISRPNQAPAYSFGSRAALDKINEGPAPNLYNIPTMIGTCKEGNKKAAPSFTISGRNPLPEDLNGVMPGPGAYDVVTDVLREKSPAFTMRIRHKDLALAVESPGPAAFYPENVELHCRPAYSFGIRHSPYIGQFKDPSLI